MSQLFRKIFNPFSRYADSLERKADWVLRWIIFYDKFAIQRQLLGLMQKNLVVLDLWLERKYKGYKYLTKGNRKKLYANAQKIADKFNLFCTQNRVNEKEVTASLQEFGFEFVADRLEKIKYISQIMAYLRPGKYYQYLEGASFGKLLKDPDQEPLIGDCNQIVTLYTFLYSLKYPLSDLKIKLPPQHVCLHFDGIDIEATNATFQKYDDYEHILPIVELLTTNLLDVSDFRDKALKIDTRTMVTAAELANRISSIRDIVEKNLKITYHNLVIDSANANDFETAMFFLNKFPDHQLAQTIYHNAVLYFTKERDFNKARYYLNRLGDPKMRDYVYNQEGYFYFKQGNLARAIEIYKNIGNQEMLKACYGEEYNKLQKKVAGAKTVEASRYYKSDYQRMKELARLMGDYELEKQVDGILKSLG